MNLKTLLAMSLIFVSSVSLATTDKYRLTLRDNPATSIVVGWNQVSGSNPVVYYGPTDQGTNWSAYPSSAEVSRTSSYRGMNNRFARITGLQPNTAYYFVIRDSQGTSSRYWFKTSPNIPTERLSFIAGGDSRNNRTPRRNANLLVSKLKPHAVLFGGDMTDNDTDSQWRTWMDDWQLTIASDGRIFPIVAARGNHESSNSTIYNLFDTPSSNIYYALTFGGSLVRTYTLNTETSISGSQTSWLTSDLQSANTTWKMAQYHKPIRPHVSSKREGTSQYNYWARPFYNHGVNLVVECDAHTVKTTWPVRPASGSGSDEGFIRDDNTGTVYVGEGCWGAPLRSNNDGKAWTRNSGQFNQFKWIFVDQGKIEVRTIRVDNAASVGSVSNSNPFIAPSNLDIWNPSNGQVVTITGSKEAPVCNITSPSNGQYYNSPRTININADASDSDGEVSEVAFYVNGQLIGRDSSSPYSIDYNIPDNGSYSITAEATDNDGITQTSDEININVGAINESLNIRINSGANDVEESGSNGSIYSNSSDLELVYDSYRNQNDQTVGLRFTNVDIPQGATISNAYIQFTVDETDTGSTSLTITGHDTDDAPAFGTNAYNVSNRTRTSASVNWNPPSWTSVGQAGSAQATPDISPIIQEIVNRSGWSNNNDIAIIISGTGSRAAEAYDGCTSCAPTLYIDYSLEDSGDEDCSTVQLDFNNFESGWGIWNDGGSDASRVYESAYANGNYSIRLRDNTSTSVMTTDVIDLSSFEELTVSFSYYPRSMDSSAEDFWLQISTNGGSTYTTVEEWNLGDEFENDRRYNDEINIEGPFSSDVRLRFRCDATANGDYVYIDDVSIEGCSNGNGRGLSYITNDGNDGDTGWDGLDNEDLSDIYVSPSPFKELLNFSVPEVTEALNIKIYGMNGSVIKSITLNTNETEKVIDTNDLKTGVYILSITGNGSSITKKIIKN